ncbi:MAG: hypothetical protein K6G81_10755 [Lachnospiraceae bacterium]|nr:hypothetical protein [Lachnospiraceae bacterium]
MSGFDQQRFEETKDAVLASRPHSMGFGSLAEKSVHAVLKRYYSPTDDDMEVPVGGFVADICYGMSIIEIQTRQFYTMKRKLEAFLPEYDVTIVYPLPVSKTLFYIDPDTGKVKNRRKSNKKRNIYELFYEMYGIRDYINDPHLHFKALLYEAEEYRYQGLTEKHGRKERVLTDIVPARVLEEISIESVRDLMMFVPVELDDVFTTRDFARAAGIAWDLAGFCVGILKITGNIEKTGTGPRGVYLYSVRE